MHEHECLEGCSPQKKTSKTIHYNIHAYKHNVCDIYVRLFWSCCVCPRQMQNATLTRLG